MDTISFIQNLIVQYSNSIRATDPTLVLVTCVYLATKIEECPIHIKMVTQEAKTVFQGKVSSYKEKKKHDWEQV